MDDTKADDFKDAAIEYCISHGIDPHERVTKRHGMSGITTSFRWVGIYHELRGLVDQMVVLKKYGLV